MSAMTPIYSDNDISIERDKKFRYILRCNSAELMLNGDNVFDQNVSKIMSFKPKIEMWWDVKLFLKKKLSIGNCSTKSGEATVSVQGVLKQDLFYDDAHILTRKGKTIFRGSDFDLNNINHCAVMLIMLRYHDQRD